MSAFYIPTHHLQYCGINGKTQVAFASYGETGVLYVSRTLIKDAKPSRVLPKLRSKILFPFTGLIS